MLIETMKKKFSERTRKNSAYSLRAFSRSLGMDSSTVSAIMNGKRPLSIKNAHKIIMGLEIFDPIQIQMIISETFAKSNPDIDHKYKNLSLEVSEAIAFWENFAILALLEIKVPKTSERYIAEQLSIPIGIVKECCDRLERLSLIKKSSRGWELTGKNLATTSDIPSSSLREGHRQYIQKALQSLEEHSVEVRDITGITMAVSRKKIKEAKKLIQEFRKKLSAFMENGEHDSVYRLNIQLFPLSVEKRK